MRARAAAWKLLGPTFVGLALAFLPAGVRVARADAERPPEPVLERSRDTTGEPGARAVCSPDRSAATTRRAAGVAAQVVERLRRESAAGDSDVVVLNGRGHNYPRIGGPAASFGAIDAELQGTSRPRP